MSFTLPRAIAQAPGRTQRQLERAKAAFSTFRSGEEDERAAQIAALPVVEWKGRALYTLTCPADFGKGPHQVNVPEAVLWALIDLRAFRCPYHPTAEQKTQAKLVPRQCRLFLS